MSLIIISIVCLGLFSFLLCWIFIPQFDLWLIKAKHYARKHGKICCLTFDDGPSEWTKDILNILKRNRVKATFFVTGQQALKHPDIIDSINLDGHDIGSHAYSHKKLAFLSKKDSEKEIFDGLEALVKSGVDYPRLFRAPHGFRRLFLKKLLTKYKLKLIPWTKGIWDTDMPSKDELVRRTKKKLRNLEILLLHDGLDNRKIVQDRKSTVEALPDIIYTYKTRGYKFMGISELISKMK